MTPRNQGRGALHLLRAASLLALLFMVDAAAACPVCFSAANEENRTAIMLMTGFLTVLPLALIGFTVRWYVRRVKSFEKLKRAHERAARRRRGARQVARHGRVLKAPAGYFERGYAGTPRGQ